ncbi:hypothetical protein BZA05DRAFT_473076 [Tricharina praecox]|uniref:uncharacterized protein n=1 Tax=Tricharina praecox TaxID=43433 RepID=UPI00221EF258|nr:uncharacterized protein BZA05DRAFT_473076 [Tricharina praecox]KAI5853687.1 hypothetical protein BZA05DRAFT_473076 [Tricharina praecox]
MIVAVVTAVAITQREARREKAAKEAEAAAAAKKDILVVGAGIHGLLVALFCRAQGFTVTIVDQKGVQHFKGDDRASGGLVWLAPNALTVLERMHEKLPGYLQEAACAAETLHYRRYKSGKSLSRTALGGGGTSTHCLALTATDFLDLLLDFTTAKLVLNTEIVEYKDAPEDLDGPLPHGRPYALAADGQKFYADCIVACDGNGSLARKHVLASAGEEGWPDIDTKWTVTTGSVLAAELGEHEKARKLVDKDRVDVWVGEGAYVSTVTVGGGEEVVFDAYDLDMQNEGELLLEELVEGWEGGLVHALSKAGETTSTRLKIRQKPSTLVSRKSRKVLMFGDNGFTFPPHSPHLEMSYHVEAAQTLAVCLRKAASVPLGLEIYTRMRNPRYARAMMMAQDRFNTITASAAEGELEAAELKWEIEPGRKEEAGPGEDGIVEGWWDYDAEKWADKNFEGVIDILTAELLGKQRAMAEAQAKAQAEVEAEAKKKAEGEQAVVEKGGQSREGDQSEDGDDDGEEDGDDNGEEDGEEKDSGSQTQGSERVEVVKLKHDG